MMNINGLCMKSLAVNNSCDAQIETFILKLFNMFYPDQLCMHVHKWSGQTIYVVTIVPKWLATSATNGKYFQVGQCLKFTDYP